MSDFKKLDSSGEGSIVGESGWSTHIHRSNDDLDPWYSIKDERTGDTFKGLDSRRHEFFDRVLPDWMK